MDKQQKKKKKLKDRFDDQEQNSNLGIKPLPEQNHRSRVSELRQEVLRLGRDIIESDRFDKARNIKHHLHYTVAGHSVETAMYALVLARWLRKHGVHITERDAVRAALLHDIGMTEEPVVRSPSYRKAFLHPAEGRRIANEEFHMNEVQQDAIRHHMWPVGLVPPRHIIGWIVMTSDKMSSMNETKTMVKNRVKETHGEK